MNHPLRPALLVTCCTALFASFAHADEAALLNEAREVAMKVPPKLVQVLMAEIDKDGHASAISVCREKAPAMAKAASEESGWTIRRTSLKNRNPKAVPDAWERAVLEDFDRRVAAGEKAQMLEKGELFVADGKKEFRYMKALPVQEVCLGCHGGPDRIKADVPAKLKELYPNDKATGYSLGQIRGAMTLRKAVD